MNQAVSMKDYNSTHDSLFHWKVKNCNIELAQYYFPMAIDLNIKRGQSVAQPFQSTKYGYHLSHSLNQLILIRKQSKPPNSNIQPIDTSLNTYFVTVGLSFVVHVSRSFAYTFFSLFLISFFKLAVRGISQLYVHQSIQCFCQ